MDPYRTLAVDELPEAPRDPGIVGDVIRQFADPKAFYRELVQNAIDAGSPSVEIRIEHDQAAQKLGVAVRDRGEGMSRDTLENQLLVLFRSTKESAPTKIGKFGIGFASVLAPEPEVVIVQSVRDGRRLTLHLFRDLTYELFDGGTATQAGTSVELVLAVPDAEVEAFVKASVQALVRWCRHASVPIEMTWVPSEGPPQTTRIDRPLAIEKAIVQVIERSPDGHLVAAVGITPLLEAYTGFFNHGLTLHESAESITGRVAAKIQD
nr:ATP-binding protein [Deltaproteobacteria bacterium]